MKIVIATVLVPFLRGGAEAHAEGLRDALVAAGHEAEIVAIPFKWYPPEKIVDHMLICRMLDLTEVNGTPVDLLIGLKFPAYLIPHPNKVLWILHQFRTAYEQWDHSLGDLIFTPLGAQIRDVIREADRQTIPESKAVFANSVNVASRLKKFCNIDAQRLYHPPPQAEKFYSADAEDYLFFPSRLCAIKRQTLVLESLTFTIEPVHVRFAGAPDVPAYADELKLLAQRLKVAPRVSWLGPVSDAEKLKLYAHAIAVVYPPLDEDYGYVTLEAMLAAKPVITCNDSGGPLEFLTDGETGLLTEPRPEALAQAMDQLWRDRARARDLGQAARDRYDAMDITWANVVSRLLE